MNFRLYIPLILCVFFSLSVQAQSLADSLAIVHARWNTKELQKGLTFRHARFDCLYDVPQNIVIYEINPKKYKFTICNHHGMVATSQMAERNHAGVAINGSFYNMQNGETVCFLQEEGTIVGMTTSKKANPETGVSTTNVTGAVEIKKGKIKILPWDPDSETSYAKKHTSVLASGPLLRLKDKDRSLARSSRSFVTTKHPRSVIARTADGKILLIVVDGRRKGIAEGINLPELTHFTRIMGCTDVLNLDGGGSSTLWDTYQGITNMPSGNRERNVANSIFIQ